MFHDDQHGTAIIVAAAVTNGLEVAGKSLGDVKLVALGCGSGGHCLPGHAREMGLDPEKIWVCDRHGVVYQGRTEMDPWRKRYARDTDARALGDVVEGADIFLGLSASGVLGPELVKRMAERPLILALANPVPEILPRSRTGCVPMP